MDAPRGLNARGLKRNWVPIGERPFVYCRVVSIHEWIEHHRDRFSAPVGPWLILSLARWL